VCDSCGWHGWRTPPLAPSVAVQLDPQTRGTTVDPSSSTIGPSSSTIGGNARPGKTPELFEVGKPSGQARIPERQPESVRQSAPTKTTPRVGWLTAPWMSQVLSDAIRLLQRVPYDRVASGIRRYPLRRLVLLRSDAIRSWGFFALGLAAGAFVVWTASESALQVSSPDTPSPTATSATTGTKPAEPSPSQLDSPAGLVAKVSSDRPPSRSAQQRMLDRPATVVSDPPAPSRPEPRPTTRARPTAQRTQNVVGATAVGRLARSRGSLAIVSRPPGARVSLNGRRVGSTPLVLKDVAAGTHTVRVEADGYQAWAWTARVVANQRSQLSVKLFSSTTNAHR
jgi:PEGA domain